MNKLVVNSCEKDVHIDRVIIGTNRYGRIEKKQAFEQLDLFFDILGGKTIDTATVYGETIPGISKSELVIGEWLRDRNRRDATIITKGCCFKLDSPNISRVTPAALKEDLFQSLDALGTDYVDVYLLHRDNLDVPVGEMVDALDEHVRKGLIRAIGTSNWWMKRILEGNAYAEKYGRAKFAVSEIQWSFVTKKKAIDIPGNEALMTTCEYLAYKKANIPVLAFSAQANGYIPKFLSGSKLTGGAKEFDNEESQSRAIRVSAVSRITGFSPTQISLSYLMHCGIESAVVIGASSEAQLKESARCTSVVLTNEQVSFLRGDDTF